MTRTEPALWRQHLATLPLPAYFAFLDVTFSVGTWALAAAFDGRPLAGADLALRFLFGAGFAGIMTAVVAKRRRDSGGPQNLLRAGLALRSGNLPDGADPAVWRPLLERQMRVQRRARWLSPLIVLPVLGFGILGLTFGPAATTPALALIVLVLALILAVEVSVARSLRRAHTLLQQLPTTASPAAPAASRPVDRGVAAIDQRPHLVDAAVLCGLLCAAGVAVSLIQLLLQVPELHAAVSVSAVARRVGAQQAGQLTSLVLTIAAALLVLLAAALTTLSLLARAGSDRARGALVAPVLATGLLLVHTRPLTVLVLLLALTTLVLLYLPAPNTWFTTRRHNAATDLQ